MRLAILQHTHISASVRVGAKVTHRAIRVRGKLQISALHEADVLLHGAAGACQDGVEVEHVAKIFQQPGHFGDLLCTLVSVQVRVQPRLPWWQAASQVHA